jgi:hypothetical protein
VLSESKMVKGDFCQAGGNMHVAEMWQLAERKALD